MCKCLTEGCNKSKAPRRRYCYSCIKRDYARKYPIKYAYTTLKCNAKRRGKSFQLTLEEFSRFCVETEYMKNRGIKKTSYHIDRIDETKGYTIDNIQVLTNTENVKKYLVWSSRDEFGNNHFTVRVSKSVEYSHEDCPF